MTSPFDIAARYPRHTGFPSAPQQTPPGTNGSDLGALWRQDGQFAALLARSAAASRADFVSQQAMQYQLQMLQAMMQWLQGGGCGGTPCCNRMGQNLQSQCRSCCGGGCPPCTGSMPDWFQRAYQQPQNASALNHMLGVGALCCGGGCPPCSANACAQASQWLAANGFNASCTTGPFGALPACWGGVCAAMNQPGGCTAPGCWNAWSQVLGQRM